MRARLLGISGPLTGVSFEIREAETSVGRHANNSVTIEDPAVSRRHCLILRNGDRFRIRDLGSRNGTYVNGLPVEERRLESGDEVRIGNAILAFSVRDDRAQASETVRLADADWSAGSVVVLPNSDARYLHMETLSDTARTVKDLKALLRFGAAIPSIRGLAAIEEHLLGSVLEVIPAAHGSILLVEGGGELGPARVSG